MSDSDTESYSIEDISSNWVKMMPGLRVKPKNFDLQCPCFTDKAIQAYKRRYFLTKTALRQEYLHPEKCFVESTKILLNQQKFPLAHI